MRTSTNIKKEMSQPDNAVFKRSVSSSLRLSEEDANYFKNIANEEGIPYQTYMASILHKFVKGKLIDKDKLSEEKKHNRRAS